MMPPYFFNETRSYNTCWQGKHLDTKNGNDCAISFPIWVTGQMSPYPTVVKVATAHHIAAGILEKLSG